MSNHIPNTGFNAGQFPGQPQATAGQFIGQSQANAGQYQGQFIGQPQGQYQGQFIGQSQANAGEFQGKLIGYSHANAGEFQGQLIGYSYANAVQFPDQAQVNVEQFAGQPQLWRDDLANQSLYSHNQGSFLQDTGTQVKNMTQGAAELGKGAALSMVNIARGAATGAANIAQGAAEAVKNKIGVTSPNSDSRPSDPPSHPNSPSSRV